MQQHAKNVPFNTPFAKATTHNGVNLRLVKNTDGSVVYEYEDDMTGGWTAVSPTFTKSQFGKYKWEPIDVHAPAPTPPTPTLDVGATFKTYSDAKKHAALAETNKPFAVADGPLGSKFRLYKDANGDIQLEVYSPYTSNWTLAPHSDMLKTVSGNHWTVIDNMTTISGPTPTAPPVTVTVPADFKKQLLTQLNNKGPLLGKSTPLVYEKIAEIRVWAKKQGHDLSDLDLLRILDAEKAASLGVSNSNLYEKKIVEWLKTPGAAKKAEAIYKKVATGPVTPAYTPPAPAAPVNMLNNASELGDISLSAWRSKISTTDTSFPVHNLTQATALQNEMFAHAARLPRVQDRVAAAPPTRGRTRCTPERAGTPRGEFARRRPPRRGSPRGRRSGSRRPGAPGSSAGACPRRRARCARSGSRS